MSLFSLLPVIARNTVTKQSRKHTLDCVAKARNDKPQLSTYSKKTIILVFFSMCFASTVHAEEYTYAPKACEFQITFPEKPYMVEKCAGLNEKKKCVEVVTYKKILPPDASVDIRLTCEKVDEENPESKTKDYSELTLKSLLRDKNYEAYDLNSEVSDKDNVTRSTSLSIGVQNDVPYIYSGQVWIGKQSLLTVESTMKGEKNDEIDKIFAEILKSLVVKSEQKN